MNKNKILACLLSATMLMGSMSAFAAAPSEYDGYSYESLGYSSTDPDGEVNLAVVANGDVKIIGDAMKIVGSVYSNGDIYVGNGQGNEIQGLFISGTEGSYDEGAVEGEEGWQCEGYIHVNDDGTREGINIYSTKPDYAGAIKDDNTSFECAYTAFEVPEIANYVETLEMNAWGNEQSGNLPKTISEDTHIGNLLIIGDGYNTTFTVDATNNPVNIVIDNFDMFTDGASANPVFTVVGDNQVNIYFNNSLGAKNLYVNAQVDYSTWPQSLNITGSSENTALYFTGDAVDINGGAIAAKNIYVNTESLTVQGSANVKANITTNTEYFEINGGSTAVTGVVCAPNADSRVIGDGTLYGQLHTNTLTNNGSGKIIYKADEGIAEAVATTEPTQTPEVTQEPEVTEEPEVTQEPTAEPTEPPKMPQGPKADYEGFNYAYIFGYEPYDEDGAIVLEMAPEAKLTREQVCAMLVRVDDQYNGKIGKARYLEEGIFDENATPDRWSYNALAAVAEKGAFEGKTELDPAGHVSRGEVAKIVAFMTGLSETDDGIVFEDVVGNENEVYINLVATAGYMQGYEDGTFLPEAAITRAEFCSLLNNIIQRDSDNGYYLETADGTPVNHVTYGITDIEESDWYYEIVLYATSAFDENGKVDLTTRKTNIRNTIDGFDGQVDY